jgi:hypothetical protein
MLQVYLENNILYDYIKTSPSTNVIAYKHAGLQYYH